MATFIVTYDLDAPGQKYKCLSDKLEKYETHWNIQGSVWIIASDKTAEAVAKNLLTCLDEGDNLIVSEMVGSNTAWYGFGKDGTDWLQSVL